MKSERNGILKSVGRELCKCYESHIYTYRKKCVSQTSFTVFKSTYDLNITWDAWSLV